MEVLSSQGAMGPVVAVIPAHNEERFIGSVVLAAKKYCDLVIVVDDGSSDRTADLADAAGAMVIRRPVQGGKGAALNTGFEIALQYRPRATVMLDGDAQHDPAEIVDVARPILEGWADVVIGSRFLTDRRDSIPWWRQIGQVALTIITNRASGVRLTDSQTGYRAFSLEALSNLRFRSRGLSVESEMQFLLNGTNLRLAEVPIHVQYLDGNKRNPVAHGLSVIDTIMGLMARRRPLLFFSVPGLLLVVSGLLVGYHAFHVVRSTHQIPLGSTVLGMLALVIGLLLGVTGTILNTLEHFATRVTQEIVEVARERSTLSWDETGHSVDPLIHRSHKL
ncbi:MAG: glycosyltransferase family 2 protein [Firmicutes bacterium]|nr:glycosyltransferase family 2 protein [Bacillota bacterium]